VRHGGLKGSTYKADLSRSFLLYSGMIHNRKVETYPTIFQRKTFRYQIICEAWEKVILTSLGTAVAALTIDLLLDCAGLTGATAKREI
jgi:hypothetical protein